MPQPIFMDEICRYILTWQVRIIYAELIGFLYELPYEGGLDGNEGRPYYY